jgi:hypothetical protein
MNDKESVRSGQETKDFRPDQETIIRAINIVSEALNCQSGGFSKVDEVDKNIVLGSYRMPGREEIVCRIKPLSEVLQEVLIEPSGSPAGLMKKEPQGEKKWIKGQLITLLKPEERVFFGFEVKSPEAKQKLASYLEKISKDKIWFKPASADDLRETRKAVDSLRKKINESLYFYSITYSDYPTFIQKSQPGEN